METPFDKGISLRQLAVDKYGATLLRERADFGALVERVKAARCIRHLGEYLENVNWPWLYIDGDVEVEGDLFVDAPVVIGGSLKVAGIYDDYVKGMGHTLVMENLEAEHLLTWCDLGVLGDLKVRGLIYAYYNDHYVEISGRVEARVFVINDKSCEFEPSLVKVELLATDYSSDGETNSLRVFHPDLIFAALEPTRYDPEFEAGYDGRMPHYGDCQERLWLGEPIFRDEAADPGLMDLVEQAMILDAETEADALRALQGQDALVDQIVEYRLTPEPEPEPYVPPTREEIAAMLAHEDEWERRQLLRHHDVLLFEDFAALSRDEDKYTRERCAEAIRDQAFGQRKAILTEQERHSLAELLAADPDPEVKATAMGILPTTSQERFGFESLKAIESATGDPTDDTEAKEREKHSRVLRNLAWYSPSERLQLALFDSGRKNLLTSLASNSSLAVSAQRKIQALLPAIEAAGIESDEIQDFDLTISFMLENPVTDPTILHELAAATLHHSGRTSILRTWRVEAPMTAELVDILRNAVDKNMRYEWPEMVLRAPDATRAQLTEAIQILATQDRDEDQAAWLASLAPLDDSAFFAALRNYGDETIAPSNAARRTSAPSDVEIDG